MPVLYIDVVWALNVIMDAFILTLTSFFCRRKRTWWRIGCSSIVGAMYVFTVLWPNTTFLWSLVGKLALSMIMIWIAFPMHSIRDTLQTLAVFYVASFVTGGAALAFSDLMQSPVVGQSGLVISAGRAAWLVDSSLVAALAACPLAYTLGRLMWSKVQTMKRREASIWRVVIRLGEQVVELDGLLDTGNQLREPVSGTPVLVAAAEVIGHLLPESVRSVLLEGANPVDRLADLQLDDGWQARFRVVPYRTVGTSSGLLLAVRPDSVTIERNGEIYAHERVLVAVHMHAFSTDGQYQAIVHPDLVTSDSEAS